MADIPSRAEHQRRFMALDAGDRRAIIRAVNRGRAVEVRKHAPLAVGVARRQQRFWRWAWVLGPAMTAVQVALVPIEIALFNGLLATLGLMLVAWFWYRRAVRAEQRNLEIVQGRRAPGDDSPITDTAPARRQQGGHLPGDRRRTRASGAADPGTDGQRPASPQPLQPGMRPYRPRGRKRRDKH